jgi:ABC-2 type transport system ATP-binding protein
MTTRRAAGAIAACLLLALAACSDDDADAADADPAADADSQAAGGSGNAGDDWVRPECSVPEAAEAEVAAVAVDGSTSDVDITSFDGTRIRAHWFPVDGASSDDPHPTILMGPGWGQPGDTNVEAVGILGSLDIASLHDAGYNVLTWDPRGFGASEGLAQVDSVDYEARDVQQLLTWVATQPEVALDGPGDPTSGMAGGSYGGGIQLVTAAIDCRVDALVPVVAWHSLGTSLYKDETFKQGWATLLTQVASDSVDPHVTSAYESGMATGVLSEEDRDWFLDRGPAELVEDIQVPTLFVGGTVDTLFTLDENVTNFRILQGNGVPTAMFWFCGGHGVCLTDPGDPALMQQASIDWLDRYVKGDETVSTGEAFAFLDQDGRRYVADDYPTDDGHPIAASGDGTLELVAEGGAGPATIPEGVTDLLAGFVAPVTPAPASNAVEVAIQNGTADRLILGAPELTITYSGTVEDGERPTRVFAQIVDDETGFVLGNQITPVPVTLDGDTHELTIPLEIVVHHASAGSTFTLQLVATTPAYGEPRLGGEVEFEAITISLPTMTDPIPV